MILQEERTGSADIVSLAIVEHPLLMSVYNRVACRGEYEGTKLSREMPPEVKTAPL